VVGLDDARGVLYPARLPSFHRELAAPHLAGVVRWFWVPRWQLPEGAASRQELLPFPASNLVVEPDGVSLYGPTTRGSYRELRGSGWAVGALLRPAGLGSLCADPWNVRDTAVPFVAPDLHQKVMDSMGADETAARDAAVGAFAAWAAEHMVPDEAGLLANAMEDLISADRTVVRVDQVARHLGVSTRTVQRLARRYIGLSPAAVIRRYRLQEAAQRLRLDPSTSIAQAAADLGYADHAHLDADFRKVLGLAPSSYRRTVQ